MKVTAKTSSIEGKEFKREAMAIFRFSLLLSILKGLKILISLSTFTAEKSSTDKGKKEVSENKTIEKSSLFQLLLR